MKRYLTVILFAVSILIIYIGAKLQIYWSGILAWGLALICLIFAVHYSKYIPNEKASKKKKKEI
ncbi:hypothetical protein [Oceanobacillus sojae]|uniref:hypothetical protein n=1 Tax=Oceanobacillus sojae TaxID=582851 RepID=UPI00098831A9|nr:hypothetical protein [Oceanobacillus sojae]MCT1902837.1 hypothetical protein [Oceanobacillus sojae]